MPITEIVISTFDWVPEYPRGYVRDLRARWALEEAGLPYSVRSVPFKTRSADHYSHQPFGQVPWLTDGDISLFETGAMLLHIGERSEALLPRDARGRAQVQQWLFAALNSVEMAAMPQLLFKFAGDTVETPSRKMFDGFLTSRLQHMEAVLAGREWLVNAFSIADIAMADVLRLVNRLDKLADYPVCCQYLARSVARPAFIKAYNDQLAHFAAAD